MAENPLLWPVSPAPAAGSGEHEARALAVAESVCASLDQCWQQWKMS